MSIITPFDYLLFPVFFLFFYLFIRRKAKKQPTAALKKYYNSSFALHMFGSVTFGLIVQYYYGAGDAFTYYAGGEFLRNAPAPTGKSFELFFMNGKDLFDFAEPFDLNDWSRYGMQTSSTLAMEKISGLLSFISFHSFLVIGMFMSLFAFAGQWKLFTALSEIMNGKNQKILAYTVLFLPSIWFWGSGLGKDALSMGALGYLSFALYRIFVKGKISLINLIVAASAFSLLYIIKSYIAAAFIVAFGFSLVIGFIHGRKTALAKFFTGSILLAGICVLFFVVLFPYIDTVISDSAATIATSVESYANASTEDERSKGSFETSDVDISIGGFIQASPAKISNTLFRPFVWETRKPIMAFSALESLAMLLALLYLFYLCRFFRFFRYVFANAALTFSFVFCIILGIMIGFTTFNFGTLVRYRIPLLPFYGFMLVYIYTKVKEAGTAVSSPVPA